MIDKDKLKELARAEGLSGWWWDVESLIERAVGPESAEFIVAANPAAILELLAELESAHNAALAEAVKACYLAVSNTTDPDWQEAARDCVSAIRSLATTSTEPAADQARRVVELASKVIGVMPCLIRDCHEGSEPVGKQLMEAVRAIGASPAPSAKQEPIRGAFLNTQGGVTLCQPGRERDGSFAAWLYAAPSASASPAAPGFVLVPVEPTREMLNAIWGKSSQLDLPDAYAAMLAASPAAAVAAPTDISTRLRERATGGYTAVRTEDGALMLAAATEIEHYYGGMLAWKQTAQKKDRDWQEEVTKACDARCAARAAAPVAGSQHVPEAVQAILRRMANNGYACYLANTSAEEIESALAAAAPAVPVPAEQDQARDAARYRWLRSDDIEVVPGQREICVYLERLPFREDQADALLTGSDLDDAVDAAMAAPSLQQPKE